MIYPLPFIIIPSPATNFLDFGLDFCSSSKVVFSLHSSLSAVYCPHGSQSSSKIKNVSLPIALYIKSKLSLVVCEPSHLASAHLFRLFYVSLSFNQEGEIKMDLFSIPQTHEALLLRSSQGASSAWNVLPPPFHLLSHSPGISINFITFPDHSVTVVSTLQNSTQ